jgi:hypothetical protein
MPLPSPAGLQGSVVHGKPYVRSSLSLSGGEGDYRGCSAPVAQQNLPYKASRWKREIKKQSLL